MVKSRCIYLDLELVLHTFMLFCYFVLYFAFHLINLCLVLSDIANGVVIERICFTSDLLFATNKRGQLGFVSSDFKRNIYFDLTCEILQILKCVSMSPRVLICELFSLSHDLKFNCAVSP